MDVIARSVPKWCDWLIRTFADDEPMRHGSAASAWAWETLMRENEELRRERNDLAGAVDREAGLRGSIKWALQTDGDLDAIREGLREALRDHPTGGQ